MTDTEVFAAKVDDWARLSTAQKEVSSKRFFEAMKRQLSKRGPLWKKSVSKALMKALPGNAGDVQDAG